MKLNNIVVQRALRDYDKNIVNINKDIIKELIFDKNTLNLLNCSTFEEVDGMPIQEAVSYILTINSINFMYWDGFKDNFVRYQHDEKIGALAAFKAFSNLWKENINVVNEKIIKEYFGNISEIDSRVKILNESLSLKNQLKCFALIDDSIDNIQNNISTELASKIADIMPLSFKEPYLKKIQLALYEIAKVYENKGYKINLNITVAADYQLPKVLEAIGILSYNDDLTKIISNKAPILKNSKEELAIRAATILSCEQICKEHNLTIPQIDKYLWLIRNSFPGKNFHLTKTTDY